jgi:hypothetical protein
LQRSPLFRASRPPCGVTLITLLPSLSLSLLPWRCTRVCRCARGISLEAEMEFYF